MIDCIEKQLHLQNNMYLQQQQQQPNQHQPQTRQASLESGNQQAPNQLVVNQQALLPIYTQQQNFFELPQPFPAGATNNADGHQTGNELIGYYFGSISRETAEWILRTHGNQTDGAYLLRSSGPNDDFVLSLMVVSSGPNNAPNIEVLHYKIVETEDSFVALHGQVGDEKFATIDELIEKAQGVATKPRWPINRQTLDSQILPPTYWGLTVDQIRLAILIKANQWGFPLVSAPFQSPSSQLQLLEQQQPFFASSGRGKLDSIASVTTLNNETIRTLIYKSIHEFQPWFHGKISREEAERRIEEGGNRRDGRFLVRERDNYSYAMCLSHKKTTKHYRIDVLPTGELAIQDGRKFTSLMALVSHYTIMSDGLWCALTEACARPLQSPPSGSSCGSQNSPCPAGSNNYPQQQANVWNQRLPNSSNNIYCVPPTRTNRGNVNMNANMMAMQILPPELDHQNRENCLAATAAANRNQQDRTSTSLICTQQGGPVNSIKGPIKEWIQNINQKWSQLLAAKNQHQSLQSFLFGSQNPLNNHCKHNHRHHHHHHHSHSGTRRKCRNGHTSCACIQQEINRQALAVANPAQHASSNNNGNPLARILPPNCLNMINNSNPQACAPGQSVNNNAGLQSSPYSSFLSSLPQPSGFPLNSQSFVGSPLFAVQPKQVSSSSQLASGAADEQSKSILKEQQSGSCSDGSGQNHDEKLISPAQSIAANLNTNSNPNNPYHLGSDIYGSQTSTAIVNDLQQHRQLIQQLAATSSSSSSGGCQNNLKNSKTFKENRGAPQMGLPGNHQHPKAQPNKSSSQQQRQIVCGQHAGPAFRYTNCQEEHSRRACQHRTLASLDNFRATDDLQLTSQSSQLVGPAAMSKFVQFQDGQCLRTHRDTQSIQMAYLSSRSRQSAVADGGGSLEKQDGRRANNQVPFKLDLNKSTSNNSQSLLNKQNLSIPNKRSEALVHSWQDNNAVMMNNLPIGCDQEVDLMDCGDNFEFKYDAKLIKSSSIETLCGAGGEPIQEELEEDLSNFKSNSELLMSLQAFWQGQQVAAKEAQKILVPIQCYSNFLNQQPDDQQNATHQLLPAVQEDIPMGQVEQLVYEEAAERNLGGNNLAGNDCERFEHMRKKHDLDEVTTAILAELTASLKAQVDLKNKRSGLGVAEKSGLSSQHEVVVRVADGNVAGQFAGVNPRELFDEFDTIGHNSQQR